MVYPVMLKVCLCILFMTCICSNSHFVGASKKQARGDAVAIAEAYRQKKKHEATVVWKEEEKCNAKELTKFIKRTDTAALSKRNKTETVC